MYILKKQLPFMGDNYSFYKADFSKVKYSLERYAFGSFMRSRAKIYRWWLHAWFVNLFFKGQIEKIHIQL